MIGTSAKISTKVSVIETPAMSFLRLGSSSLYRTTEAVRGEVGSEVFPDGREKGLSLTRIRIQNTLTKGNKNWVKDTSYVLFMMGETFGCAANIKGATRGEDYLRRTVCRSQKANPDERPSSKHFAFLNLERHSATRGERDCW